VPAARLGLPQTHDLASRLVGQHDVLLGVPLLLATVVVLATLAVLRAADGTFGAVEQEGQARAGGQHVVALGGRAGGQLQLVAQGLVDQRSQAVDPVVGLALAKAEQEGPCLLGRVMAEVEEQEQQLVGEGSQDAVAAAAGPSPGLGAGLGLGPRAVLVGLCQGGEQLGEGRGGQAGQLRQDTGRRLSTFKVQHGRNPQGSREKIVYG
jgi:hypothetical protein